MKIIAVVVTYNRLELLKECLRSVADQTIPLDEVVIVNNGSTDGTRDYLSNLSDAVYTILHQENTGASGGFHTGISTAYQNGADWIWTMDDDVRFEKDCLEQLLVYKDTSGCIQPYKLYADKEPFLWELHFDIDTLNTYTMRNTAFQNGREVVYVNVACFEGMLINRTIVDKIGYPDKRFFIVNDDTLYGFLASRYTNIAYVRKAIAHSAKVSYGSYESDMYLYYYIRNQHLLEEYINTLYSYANRKTQKILFHLYVIKKLFLASTGRKKLMDKVKTFRVILKAYKDYRLKKTGKTY